MGDRRQHRHRRGAGQDARRTRRACRGHRPAARSAGRHRPRARRRQRRRRLAPPRRSGRRDRSGCATAAARAIEAAWGGIDVAIFNAGGVVEHDFVATMALNYFSVVYGIEAVLDGMLARGRGHIAAVASLAGYRPAPVATEYGASKAAVIYLMDGLRFSLAPQGVRVTVINPGFVRTPLTDRNDFTMPFLVEPDDAAERIVRGLERGKKEIHFPAPMSWTAKLLRVMPYPVYERLIRALQRAPATKAPTR